MRPRPMPRLLKSISTERPPSSTPLGHYTPVLSRGGKGLLSGTRCVVVWIPAPLSKSASKRSLSFSTLLIHFPIQGETWPQSAEDFIVGWARELPRSQPIEIIVHLPAPEAEGRAAQQLSDALSNYFRYRAERLGLDLRELFSVGRWSLLIGLTVLAACVILGQYLAGQFDEGYLNRFFNEGLIILGSQLEADGDIPL